jgi:hypothetical protein
MRRFILVVIAIAAIAGCGGGLKDKIVGTWKIDVNSMKMPEVPESMKNSPEFKAQMDQMKQQMGAGRIEFKADGSVIPTGLGPQQNGKWSLEGNEIKLVDDKGKPETSVKATVSADGSKIHLEPLASGASKTDQSFDLIKA